MNKIQKCCGWFVQLRCITRWDTMIFQCNKCGAIYEIVSDLIGTDEEYYDKIIDGVK